MVSTSIVLNDGLIC